MVNVTKISQNKISKTLQIKKILKKLKTQKWITKI